MRPYRRWYGHRHYFGIYGYRRNYYRRGFFGWGFIPFGSLFLIIALIIGLSAAVAISMPFLFIGIVALVTGIIVTAVSNNKLSKLRNENQDYNENYDNYDENYNDQSYAASESTQSYSETGRCPSCGALDEGKFCSSCGTRLR